MLNEKRNGVWVLKVCIVMLIGAFVWNFASTAFTARARAQNKAESEVVHPSFLHPDLLLPGTEKQPAKAPVAGTLQYVQPNNHNITRGTVFAYIVNGSEKVPLKSDVSGAIEYNIDDGAQVAANTIIGNVEPVPIISIMSFLKGLVDSTGLKQFFTGVDHMITPAGLPMTVYGWEKLLMIAVGFLLVYLGAAKDFEPLLLVPIGFGVIFVNLPLAGMGDAGTGLLNVTGTALSNGAGTISTTGVLNMEHQGFLDVIYKAGVGNEFFPLIIFIGIGAMTDFGPLIANPKTAILGGAAQFGVFGTMFFLSVANFLPGVSFNMKEACAVSIIGGADGPTTIYIAGHLAPHLLATVAVAAYSYMALVPIIQPPIMRLLTTREERLIRMPQLREVSKKEKILFPLICFILTLLIIPSAAPLIGCLMFGNFMTECGAVKRLSDTSQNELMNIVSMFLSLGVGSQMTPEKFLNPNSIIIVIMGLVAFGIATASGLIMAKIMNLFLKDKINPLIGSAGVSAVPMAARVSNKVGIAEDPSNFLIMQAMGPNVAGVIGTAIAAGVMISIYAM